MPPCPPMLRLPALPPRPDPRSTAPRPRSSSAWPPPWSTNILGQKTIPEKKGVSGQGCSLHSHHEQQASRHLAAGVPGGAGRQCTRWQGGVRRAPARRLPARTSRPALDRLQFCQPFTCNPHPSRHSILLCCFPHQRLWRAVPLTNIYAVQPLYLNSALRESGLPKMEHGGRCAMAAAARRRTVMPALAPSGQHGCPHFCLTCSSLLTLQSL